MEFEPMLWDVPIITANYCLQRHLLEMGNKNVRHGGETRMRDRIVNYRGVATLEEIASNFDVTSGRLQRKLQEEGVSFQQLTDTVRKTLALISSWGIIRLKRSLILGVQ